MPKNTSSSPLGVTLSVLRAAQGWPQKELADVLGHSSSLLSGYESGDKTLSRERLEEIVAIMGLPAEAVDRTLAYLMSIRSLSPPEGGSMLDSARAEADVAWVRESAEAFARSILALPAERRAEDARRRARDLWDRLKKVSPKERRTLVRTTEDFRSWALCELVCERSLEAAADRADRALDLAELAVTIAELAPGEQTWRKRLRGYALAHLGNAKRVGGDLPAADEVFAKARKFWKAGEEAGVRFLTETRIFNLEASLRIAERRLSEALMLIEQALAVAVVVDDERRNLLLNKANALELTRNFEGAIAILLDALALVSGEGGNARLLFVIRFNLANNLLQSGRLPEAEALLPELRKLIIQLDNGLDTLRFRWLEGRIAAGLGRREDALRILSQVRDDFVTQRIAYDTELISAEIHAVREMAPARQVRHDPSGRF